MDKIKPIFMINAVAKGGRNGHSETDDGAIKVDLSVPKEMGGPGKSQTVTPEHLFATGYAACFGGALDLVAKRHHQSAVQAVVKCGVSIGPREEGGFGLAVKMLIEEKNIPQGNLEALVKETHQICPYSLAIRNNVVVEFEIVGAQ